MIDTDSIVFIHTSELRKIIREEVAGELANVPYYGQINEYDELMTLQKAAKYCDVCTRTLVERVKEGKLENGGTGRKYVFKKRHLDEFIFNKRHKK